MMITVIGAGAWGGALAQVLADNGHRVVIWSYNAVEAEDINTKHAITALANKHVEHQLNERITATTDLAVAIKGADYLLFAVPSFVFREVAERVSALIDKPITCISATKGLEQGTHKTMSQILEEVLTRAKAEAVVAISGPSHAEEVIKRRVTAVVVAAPDIDAAKEVQMLFNNDVYFRVYINSDRTGVEVGGALKNIIAILSGSAAAFDLGDNARAALITRGLFEIIRIGVAIGCHERTFLGLSGLGDLIVTTTSHHSRNFQAGVLLAEGKDSTTIEREIGATVEGFHAVEAAHEIIIENGVYAPLISLLYALISGEISAETAVSTLYQREMKAEFDDM